MTLADIRQAVFEHLCTLRALRRTNTLFTIPVADSLSEPNRRSRRGGQAKDGGGGKRSASGPNSGGSAGDVERLPVPGQEFGNAPRRMVGDAGEQVGDVVVRVESVELGA